MLKKANSNVALYTNLIALYKRFVQLDIKTRMFKWLLSNKKETNDNKCGYVWFSQFKKYTFNQWFTRWWLTRTLWARLTLELKTL